MSIHFTIPMWLITYGATFVVGVVVGGILATLAMSTQKAHEHLTDIGKK